MTYPSLYRCDQLKWLVMVTSRYVPRKVFNGFPFFLSLRPKRTMAYDKSEIREQAKKAIEENDLTTIAEVLCYIPCDEATIYSSDEWKIEVLEPIKKDLEVKKTSLKAKMKKEWRKAEANPTLQIAAYKLMADDEEILKLSTSVNKNEHSGRIDSTVDGNMTHTVIFKKMDSGDSSNIQ